MKTYLDWKATCPKCNKEITQDDCTCNRCTEDKYYMKRIEVMGENTYAFECPNCLDNHHQAKCPECGNDYLNYIKVKDLKRTLYQIGIISLIVGIIGIVIWIF